ncbi:MAG TPA: response regulator transcription factor [Chitinophagaceae bacterium]|nr:response regulator transcription factor [Chitinophagaceae bacterium]
MVRIAIIEDNESYRKSLQSLFGKESDMEVVYADMYCENLLLTIDIIEPDVVIMDINLPGMNGIEGVQRLREKHPALNIFMLTVFEDMDRIFDSIKAGAVGYLLKKDPPEQIIEAVRKVYRGESVMNGKIARQVLDFFNKQLKKTVSSYTSDYNLSNRENEVLNLLMDGLSYKQIASACNVSIDTISSHIRNIYSKLNIHSRAELAAKLRL